MKLNFKPITKLFLSRTGIILSLIIILGAFWLGTALVKNPQVLGIKNSLQCVDGCNGDVCEEYENGTNDNGYRWCSKTGPCECVAPGEARSLASQWCEGDSTKECREFHPGNCGAATVEGDPLECGGGQPNGCDHYSDCFNSTHCVWPASTYCVNNECQCADVGAQQAYGGPRGWAICQDTSPKCTPDPCPTGWVECPFRTNACTHKESCGPVSCNGCGNRYYVERWCKPADVPQSTPTPKPTKTPTPTPTPTPTNTPTPTPTLTPTPTPTKTPTPTPTGTLTPTPTPTATQTPTPTPTPEEKPQVLGAQAPTQAPKTGFSLIGLLITGILGLILALI